MLSTFSGLPRTAWIIFAGTVVNRLGYVVTPFLVFYLGSRGVTTDAGAIRARGVGGGQPDRPAGRRPARRPGGSTSHDADRADRNGSRPGLLFAAPNVITLALAAVLLSAAGSMVSPAAGALLTDAVPADWQRTAFSLSHWAVNIGTAVAGMLGGFLATHGYWLLFTVDATTSLAYALIVVALLPARTSRRCRAAGSPSAMGYGVVFRDPLMRALLPLFGVALVIYSLTEVCLPLAIRDHGLSTTTLGLMATLNAILVVVLQPVATHVLARFRQIPVYVSASVLTAVGIALTGVAHDVWSYAATVVLLVDRRSDDRRHPRLDRREPRPAGRSRPLSGQLSSGRGASPDSSRWPSVPPSTPTRVPRWSGGSVPLPASPARSVSEPWPPRLPSGRPLPSPLPRDRRVPSLLDRTR